MAPQLDASPCFPSAAQEQLLRAALLEGDDARRAFDAWRAAVDLENLDDASARLLPLLSRSLVRLGVKDPRLQGWRAAYRAWFAANELLFQEMRPALEALARAGIPAMLLKGAAIVALLGASGERPMVDLDVLVPLERAREAFRALSAAGFSSAVRRPERLVGARHGTPFRAPSGRELDLHWSLLWENCTPGADAPLWAAAREARLGASSVLVPAPEDLILHACVHGLQSAGGPAIRWAADVAVIAARAGSGVDWDRLAAEAARRRVVLPVRTALRWTRDRLGAPVPEPSLTRLETIEVTEGERRELARKLRPMHGLSSLAVYWSLHARATEGDPLGLLGRVARFPSYLQRNWELDHVLELPYHLWYRALVRLGAGRLILGEVVPRRPGRAGRR